MKLVGYGLRPSNAAERHSIDFTINSIPPALFSSLSLPQRREWRNKERDWLLLKEKERKGMEWNEEREGKSAMNGINLINGMNE